MGRENRQWLEGLVLRLILILIIILRGGGGMSEICINTLVLDLLFKCRGVYNSPTHLWDPFLLPQRQMRQAGGGAASEIPFITKQDAILRHF